MSVSVSEVPEPAVRRLLDGGWFGAVGVSGAYSLTPKFERVVSFLQAALTDLDPNGSTGAHQYPPVMSRAVIERAEYADAFPHLLGVIQPYSPAEPDTNDAVLMPAVCYGVYQHLADGSIDAARHFDVVGYCYRHEATTELGRFRAFRMREFVVVADADAALRWRDEWIARGRDLFGRLGLSVELKPASDPFFGPGAGLMRDSQLEQGLKYEFVARLSDDDPGTAIGSANNHKDHLGRRFAIGYRDTGPAHSSCAAFGLDRIALALIHAHGDDFAKWPERI